MENRAVVFLSKIYRRYQWGAIIGFALVHLLCLGALWVGITRRAKILGFVLYWIRMFAVTAGLHRYFSHRTYRTGRVFQFILAAWGAAGFHGGPLAWVPRHRWHHSHSDDEQDLHSPFWNSKFYSQMGWIFYSANVGYGSKGNRDFSRFPELVWLEDWHWIMIVLLAAFCYLYAGWSGIVYGMGWSTVLMLNASLSINSLSHLWGTKRYPTGDESRNNWILAILTMGEGWHNNHHHYMNTVKQGFYWWEIDLSYYILRGLALFGIVTHLKMPPARILKPN